MIESRAHDPNHPYVRKLIGCGHGRLWSEECVDCEIEGLRQQYKAAIKTVMRVRDRLRKLGDPETDAGRQEFREGKERANVKRRGSNPPPPPPPPPKPPPPQTPPARSNA